MRKELYKKIIEYDSDENSLYNSFFKQSNIKQNIYGLVSPLNPLFKASAIEPINGFDGTPTARSKP